MLYKQRRWCHASGFDRSSGREAHSAYLDPFALSGYLLLNDSRSGDGGQEYAVVRQFDDSRWLQIESITFGWRSTEKALDLLLRIIAGEFDNVDYAIQVQPKLETPAQHGSCHSCA